MAEPEKKGGEQEYTAKGKDGAAATSNKMNSAYH